MQAVPPLSIETPAKSSGNTDRGLMKKLKGFDGLAMSIGNGNGESTEGASDRGLSQRFVELKTLPPQSIILYVHLSYFGFILGGWYFAFSLSYKGKFFSQYVNRSFDSTNIPFWLLNSGETEGSSDGSDGNTAGVIINISATGCFLQKHKHHIVLEDIEAQGFICFIYDLSPGWSN